MADTDSSVLDLANEAIRTGNTLQLPGGGNISPLDAYIIKYESGGRNILQQKVDPSISTASGLEQITNSTWRSFAPKAGVDLNLYPTAMSAPPNVQLAVGHQIQMSPSGVSNWTNYNPALRNALVGTGYDTGMGRGQQDENSLSGVGGFQPINAGTTPAAAAASPIVVNMPSVAQGPVDSGPLERMAMFSILQGMMAGHKFVPVDYDPWKVAGLKTTTAGGG